MIKEGYVVKGGQNSYPPSTPRPPAPSLNPTAKNSKTYGKPRGYLVTPIYVTAPDGTIIINTMDGPTWHK